jgi:hypothetical protein
MIGRCLTASAGALRAEPLRVSGKAAHRYRKGGIQWTVKTREL